MPYVVQEKQNIRILTCNFFLPLSSQKKNLVTNEKDEPMKQILILSMLLLSSILFAQNWSPVLVNEKMNYQFSSRCHYGHLL